MEAQTHPLNWLCEARPLHWLSFDKASLYLAYCSDYPRELLNFYLLSHQLLLLLRPSHGTLSLAASRRGHVNYLRSFLNDHEISDICLSPAVCSREPAFAATVPSLSSNPPISPDCPEALIFSPWEPGAEGVCRLKAPTKRPSLDLVKCGIH